MFWKQQQEQQQNVTTSNLTGKFEERKSKGAAEKCAQGDNTVKASKNGERQFFDISCIKAESYGRAKFRLLVVDDKTDFAWSHI